MTQSDMSSGNIGSQFTNFLAAQNFHVAPAFTNSPTGAFYVAHDHFLATGSSHPVLCVPSVEGLILRADRLAGNRSDGFNLHNASAYAYRAGAGHSSAEGYRLYSAFHADLRALTERTGDREAAAAALLRSAWGAANALQITREPRDFTSLNYAVLAAARIADTLQISGLDVFLRNVAGSLGDRTHEFVDGRALLKYMLDSIGFTGDPISCPEGSILSDFVLGDLSPSEALRVAAHVVQCRNCFQVVGAMKELQSKVK